MQNIYMVITNNGDGSNGILIVKDKDTLDKLEELADDGDDQFTSGDGLQSYKLKFPDDFDVDAWVKLNFYRYYSME